ncbi:conserved hypothetical protein [Burkholderia sp. 8Y]|nr:conserved hypothetical protein [Burkholderia sp. 8Y]
MAAPGNIKRGAWCPQCAWIERRHTIEEMHAIARERGGRCLSDEYVNGSIKLEWLCKLGHAWHAQPASILAGTWCPACAYLSRCLTDEARRKYFSVGKNDVS